MNTFKRAEEQVSEISPRDGNYSCGVGSSSRRSRAVLGCGWEEGGGATSACGLGAGYFAQSRPQHIISSPLPVFFKSIVGANAETPCNLRLWSKPLRREVMGSNPDEGSYYFTQFV